MAIIYKINNNLTFLTACCKNNPSKDDIDFIKSYIINNYSNFNTIMKLALKHGVLPLMYKTLKDINAMDSQFEEIINLKNSYTNIVRRNMLMSSELIKLIKLFKYNNIEAISFKGPTLSQMAYGDIALRQYGDLDILIREKDRYKMVELLAEKGYIPEIVLKETTKEIFFESVNVIGFQTPTTGIRVEIHWKLLSKNYAIEWEEKSLWAEQEKCNINQNNIPALRIEQLLLYLCAHGAKHLFERLEWICDIDRSIRTSPQIDWAYLLSEAKKLGIRRILCLGLSLSQDFFDLKVPKQVEKIIEKDDILSKLKEKIITTNFSDSCTTGHNYTSFGLLLSMRENLKDQFRFAKHALFSTTGVDIEFVQLPKYLTFLYPIIRPFRLIIKYFKR